MQIKPTRVAAIHQPNFFPWLGYFDKIAKSDVFIFLDHVQFPKKGGIWCNRVKTLTSGDAHWITAPIVRNFHGVRSIKEMEFQPNNIWRNKFLKNLTANYARAPFFYETLDFFETLILNQENNLSRYNGAAVTAITRYLGLPTDKFCWSSEIEVDGHASEMLVSLTRAAECGAYMCGGGAEGYQDDSAFAIAGVDLNYQLFRHPVYPQVGTNKFVPGLSIIDALMNIGVTGVYAELSRA